MRTFVKFTGVRRPEEAELVPDGGAAGFLVGVAGSPWSVDAAKVPDLIERLPKGAEAWAVVRDPTADLVHSLFNEVGVDRIEVHGTVPEGLEFLEIHHLVPSLAVVPEGSSGDDPKVPPAEDYSRLHLAARGTPLDDGYLLQPSWETCQRLVDSQPGRKLVLSGGLTAARVKEALEAVRPWGIDVAAGVAASPGHLDPAKMREFVEAVAAAES